MMEMVEVFKTNVQKVAESRVLTQKLFEHVQATKISFDLEDCDKVLRIEGESFLADEIIDLVTSAGYQCEVMV